MKPALTIPHSAPAKLMQPTNDALKLTARHAAPPSSALLSPTAQWGPWNGEPLRSRCCTLGRPEWG